MRTGRAVVRRHADRWRRAHYCRKRFLFVFATLLTTVVGFHLVVVGRYTVSMIFAVDVSTANVSTTDDLSATLTHAENGTHAMVWTNSDMRNYGLQNDSVPSILLNLTDSPFATSALRTFGNKVCFVDGLDDMSGTPVTDGGCPCKTDWFGAACSIPGFIHRSRTPWSKDSLQLRTRPRRIVHAFPFNIEFDMTELRFAELSEVVDVFLILESNYTAYGTPKPLHLLDRLRKGAYASVADKVVVVLLDYFPPAARRDGWVADALHRNHLGTHGLRRLGGLRADDLLVLTDADELPRRELLSFLKWHDGYSEPVTVSYHWSVFSFYWGVPAPGGMKMQETVAVVTVAMAVYLFRYQIYSIRSAPRFMMQHAFDIQVSCADFVWNLVTGKCPVHTIVAAVCK